MLNRCLSPRTPDEAQKRWAHVLNFSWGKLHGSLPPFSSSLRMTYGNLMWFNANSHFRIIVAGPTGCGFCHTHYIPSCHAYIMKDKKWALCAQQNTTTSLTSRKDKECSAPTPNRRMVWRVVRCLARDRFTEVSQKHELWCAKDFRHVRSNLLGITAWVAQESQSIWQFGLWKHSNCQRK